MPTRRSLVLFVALGVWLALCYTLRFQLMENAHWVAVCDGKSAIVWCDVRAAMGKIIHFRVLAWAALLCSVPAFFLNGANGKKLAWLGLFVSAPALVLYTVTPAVFSVLIAALRLVRDERQSESDSNAEEAAQPSA